MTTNKPMSLKERIEMEKRDWELLKKGLKRKRNQEILKLIKKLEETGMDKKIDAFFEPLEEAYNKSIEKKEIKRQEKEQAKQEKIQRKKELEEYYEQKELEENLEFDRKMNEVFEVINDCERIMRDTFKKLHINKKTVRAAAIILALCQTGYYVDLYKKETMDSYIIVKAPTYIYQRTVQIGYEAAQLPQEYVNGKKVQMKNSDGTDYTVGFVATQMPELRDNVYRLPVDQEIPEGATEFQFEESDNAFKNWMNYFKMWDLRADKSIKSISSKDLEEKIQEVAQEKEKQDESFEKAVRNTCKTKEEAIEKYLNRPEEDIRYYYVESTDYDQKVKHYVYHY